MNLHCLLVCCLFSWISQTRKCLLTVMFAVLIKVDSSVSCQSFFCSLNLVFLCFISFPSRWLLPDQRLRCHGPHQELPGGAGGPNFELWGQEHPAPVAPPANGAALRALCGRLSGISPELSPPWSSRQWVQVVTIKSAFLWVGKVHERSCVVALLH